MSTDCSAARRVETIRDSATTRRKILATTEGVLTIWERLRMYRGGTAWCVVEASLQTFERDLVAGASS